MESEDGEVSLSSRTEENGGGGPDFRLESERLDSFRRWSQVAVVPVENLARAGFYSTGKGDEVLCFHCGIRLDRWRFGNQAAGRHLSSSPNCAFILGSDDCGNVPLTRSRVSSSAANLTPPSSRNSNSGQSWRQRLQSFAHWPKEGTVASVALAQAGFIYTGRGDTVECISCSGRLQDWMPGDDPLTEHLAHFGACSFARRLAANSNREEVGGGLGGPLGGGAQLHELTSSTSATSQSPLPPPPELHPSLSATSQGLPLTSPARPSSAQPIPKPPDPLEAKLRHLGIFGWGKEAAEWAATLAARLGTFGGWPSTASHRPLQLASAGFYYKGTGDQVKCFQCGGGLHNWTAGDSAWREHAKWFPHCDYVRLAKGHAYVEEARAETTEAEAEGETGQSGAPIRRGRRRNTTAPSRGELDLAALEENGVNVRSEAIQTALELGFAEAELASAVVGNGWRSFDSTEALIEAIAKLRAKKPTQQRQVGSDGSNLGSEEDGTKEETSTEQRSEEEENFTRLQAELRFLREQRRCKICMDAEECIVLLPCGHLCCCVVCAPALKDCPLCRSGVEGRLKILFS